MAYQAVCVLSVCIPRKVMLNYKKLFEFYSINFLCHISGAFLQSFGHNGTARSKRHFYITNA